MKCQILFPNKNKKNISKCHLKSLPRVQCIEETTFYELAVGCSLDWAMNRLCILQSGRGSTDYNVQKTSSVTTGLRY